MMSIGREGGDIKTNLHLVPGADRLNAQMMRPYLTRRPIVQRPGPSADGPAGTATRGGSTGPLWWVDYPVGSVTSDSGTIPPETYDADRAVSVTAVTGSTRSAPSPDLVVRNPLAGVAGPFNFTMAAPFSETDPAGIINHLRLTTRLRLLTCHEMSLMRSLTRARRSRPP